MVGPLFRRRTQLSASQPFRTPFLFCGPAGVDTSVSQQWHPPSFAELVQARRFNEICRILKSAPGPVDAEAWLTGSDPQFNELNSHSIPPATLLCRHKPTVAVVKAVLLHCNLWSFDAADGTVLHTAIRYGCAPAVIEAILRHDPDIVGVRDEEGRIALHYLLGTSSEHYRKYQVVALAHSLMELMPQGVTSKDAYGTTPYELAVKNRKVDRELLKTMRLIVPTKLRDRSLRTVTTTSHSDSPEVPKQVTPFKNDDDDDMSSVGSGGVSKHQHARPVVRCRAKRLCL